MRTKQEVQEASAMVALAVLLAHKDGKDEDVEALRATFEALEWMSGKDNEFGIFVQGAVEKIKTQLKEALMEDGPDGIASKLKSHCGVSGRRSF